MNIKYYVFQAITTNDGPVNAVTEYDNKDIAIMNYHQILASAYANEENVSAATVMVVDSHTVPVKQEFFER